MILLCDLCDSEFTTKEDSDSYICNSCRRLVNAKEHVVKVKKLRDSRDRQKSRYRPLDKYVIS